MAEIKSTMDLINEKMRGLEITAEEKKEFRKAREKEAAQGFFQRYFLQDDTRDLHHMMRELQDAEPGIKNALAMYLITQLSPHTSSPRIYEALTILLGTDGPSATRKLKAAAEHYRREATAERQKIERAIATTLICKGISGTAVVPHAESDNRWLNIVQRLEDDYAHHVQEMRGNLDLT